MEYVKHHIEINSQAVAEAQEAVQGETKNTAGDRYETERAMKQRETELFGKRIDEAMKQHALLMSIDASKPCDTVMPGALAATSVGLFFIAISTDEITIDGEEYCIISMESPMGQAMAHLKKGAKFAFRGKPMRLLDVW
jgi:transcription elongation GreA/GreB family factor